MMFLMRLFFWKQSSKNRERPQFVRCMSILDFFILSNCLTYQHWQIANHFLDNIHLKNEIDHHIRILRYDSFLSVLFQCFVQYCA